MNKKITFPELIETVAATTETSKRTSEVFLKELFAVVSGALERGENVKIKNFGIFKLTEVGERKSVNVNTGEEMKIPSHTKVSFSPDKSLADAINMPFSSFEAVELSDNITVDDLKQMTSLDSPDVKAVEDVAANAEIEELDTPPKKEVSEAPATGDEVVAGNEPVETFADTGDSVEGSAPSRYNVGMVAPQEVSMPIAFEGERQEHKSEPDERGANYGVKQGAEKGKTPAEDDLNELRRQLENSYVSPYKSTLFFKGYFWGVVTMLLISAVAFYSYYLYNEENTAYEEAMAFALKGSASQVMENAHDSTREAVKPAVTADSAVIFQNAGKAENAVEEEPKAQLPVVEKPVVRYDTVSRSRYLTTMSREYFGDFRFWVYIYEENKGKIEDPNSIAPGTVVKIPPASKYGIDKNNKESIEKAKSLAVSILSAHE